MLMKYNTKSEFMKKKTDRYNLLVTYIKDSMNNTNRQMRGWTKYLKWLLLTKVYIYKYT